MESRRPNKTEGIFTTYLHAYHQAALLRDIADQAFIRRESISCRNNRGSLRSCLARQTLYPTPAYVAFQICFLSLCSVVCRMYL